MPKLITKQDVSTAGHKTGQGQWLPFGGLVLLLVVVAGAAYFFTRPVITSPTQVLPALDSAQDQSARSNYLAMHDVFNELSVEYEQVAAQGLDDYQKNIKLLGKSEGILAHLDKMNLLADQLKLADSEYGQLVNRHQFNKDYWQAKLHFRQLRVSRFERGELNMAQDLTQDSAVTSDPLLAQEVKPGAADDSLAIANKPKKFQFAKPPPDMELPAGFCDLSNPASCKPEEDTTIAIDENSNLGSNAN